MRRALLVCALALAAAPAAVAAPLSGVYSEDRPTPRMKQTGFDLLRKPFTWKVIQPRPGRFEWAVTDQLVSAAAARRLTIFPFLLDSPRWASRAPRGEEGMRPPRFSETFARFAAATVRRYGLRGTFWKSNPDLPKRPIRALQVWNEPNLPVFWQPEPNARAYVKLLRAARTAIHNVDRGATVVAAGLPESRQGVAQLDYLRDAYRAGLKRAADALAIHAYAPDVPGVVAYVSRFREAMDARRHEAPLWVTEFGWADGGSASLFTVSRSLQARLLGGAVRALRALELPLRLDALFLFRWRDPSERALDVDIWPYHAGLVSERGTPKPALNAYRRALTAPVRASRATRPGELTLTVTQAGRASARVSCSKTCTVGVTVIESVERAGRSPLERVLSRDGAKLRRGRVKRFKTQRLAGRELLVSAYTASGAADIVSLSSPRTGRR